jgi:hypothetical protein
MIPSNSAFHSLHAALNGAEPSFAPIVLEEVSEKLSLEADEGLIEEVRTATVNPAYKGFGS